MRTLQRPIWIACLLLMVVASTVGSLAACQPQTVLVKESKIVVETVEVEKEKVVQKEVTKVVEAERIVPANPAATPAPGPADNPNRGGQDAGSPPMASLYRFNQMIIKNAEVSIVVEDIRRGVDQVIGVVQDTFGYILSSRTWYEGSYEYATITFGVPVNEFENAMLSIRRLALHVVDETASGTDVSDQYVSLESRLRNLEATEATIRSFLNKATTVEESLQVNAKLADITAQIEEIQGQMNYLKDRAAYSTITVHIEPAMPTPTPTPTSTPTPTPTPNVWRPDATFAEASGVLGNILRVVADMAIWVAVVFGPFVLPAALVVGFILRFNRQRHKSS